MRVQLSGEGEPIPLEAMPLPGESSDFILELAPGTFAPADYIALGFVYYEAWCIGASGGRGGDSTAAEATFTDTSFQITLNSTDWARRLELVRLQDRYYNPETGTYEYDHKYIVSGNYPNAGGETILLTAVQMYERRNPAHKLTVHQYSNAVLYTRDEYTGMGGSGGGGGLHVVAGNLDDLPASVPVVVGTAGVDAGYGQTVGHGAYTFLPEFVDDPINLAGYSGDERRRYELINYFNAMEYKYPPPRTAFNNPVAGGDGGHSSFGGTLCRASGGKGGSPGQVWDHHDPLRAPRFQEVFKHNGAGGAGGKGGQTTAGGGAAGGDDTNIDGSDGTWDGTIGQGGGGGRGYGIVHTTGMFGGSQDIVRKPGNGGIGSYSFSDTEASGAKEFKSQYIGGGGGGAHLRSHKFGSRAKGYSPHGAVLLRITKA